VTRSGRGEHIAGARPYQAHSCGTGDEFGKSNPGTRQQWCVTDAVAANSAQAQDKTADPVIFLAPVGRGRFPASLGGPVLVEASTTPFLNAGRAVAGEGVAPATRIVMRHEGQSCDALTSAVGVAAGLDVKNEYFVKYRPRREGVETADQTGAHASEPVEGSAATPPQPASAPGGSL
jgi:hypothetical protein